LTFLSHLSHLSRVLILLSRLSHLSRRWWTYGIQLVRGRLAVRGRGL